MSEPERYSLAEAFEAIGPKPKRCALGRVADQLTEDEQILLAVWLSDKDMGQADIIRMLQYCGFNVDRHAVAGHRNGQCACR